MNKAKRRTIEVKGSAVVVLSQNQQDFICLTDIARYKDAERTDYLISNWLRNRNTHDFYPATGRRSDTSSHAAGRVRQASMHKQAHSG